LLITILEIILLIGALAFLHSLFYLVFLSLFQKSFIVFPKIIKIMKIYMILLKGLIQTLE